MKMSKYYMPTLKEVPNDAEIASIQYLLRAGMIRKTVSGVYSYLPLGFRVMKKVEQIVREEMDKFGAQEVLMSAIQPKEIWEESGRWEQAGPEMFKLNDRHGRAFCLGPTHEEYFTTLIKNELKSYKQLPLNLYQIQTKYRDERRPKYGLIRCREFIMKDAYTFDADQESHEEAYMNMWKAYESTFDRLGFKYKVVKGDSGNMGGSLSHEFHAITENGESTIAYCDKCDFAETDEVASSVFTIENAETEKKEMEKIHTPGAKTIEDLTEFLDITADQTIKAILYKKEDESRVFAVFVPGSRTLNLVKLAKFVDVAEDDLLMIEPENVYRLTGAVKGYVGPFDLKEGVEVIVDSRVFDIVNGVTGAGVKDYHIKNVNLDKEAFTVADDLIQIEEGDLCPKCGEKLVVELGDEVGNIFQLGTKYSEALNATFLDKDGKAKPFYMGSYGIGVSRCVATLVEQFHDDKGIMWPMQVAPYQVIITIVNHKKEEQVELGNKLYEELKSERYEVLLDDRTERTGVKFADRDLIGVPIRITVGKAASEGIVEFSLRNEEDKIEVNVSEISSTVKGAYTKLTK